MKNKSGSYPAIAVISIIVATGAVLVTLASAATIASTDDGSNLVGNWTGESICVGPFPACHDEKVVYRIEKAPDAKGNVSIAADKIVNGKAELMGVLDFKYDPEKSTLVCDFTRGSTHGLWEFTVKGNTMEGTLVVLPDKTLARRVKLKKDTSAPPATQLTAAAAGTEPRAVASGIRIQLARNALKIANA